jgi:hypothetical protein
MYEVSCQTVGSKQTHFVGSDTQELLGENTEFGWVSVLPLSEGKDGWFLLPYLASVYTLFIISLLYCVGSGSNAAVA